MKNLVTSVLLISSLAFAAACTTESTPPAGTDTEDSLTVDDPAPVLHFKSQEDLDAARAALDVTGQHNLIPSCTTTNIENCIDRNGCWNPLGSCTTSCVAYATLYCQQLIKSMPL